MEKKRFCEFVFMTTEDYQKLATLFGEKKTNLYIEMLNDYIWSRWKQLKYKSHYYTVRWWMRRDGVKIVPPPPKEVIKEWVKPMTQEEKEKAMEKLNKFRKNAFTPSY